jgi:hypothetical protein
MGSCASRDVCTIKENIKQASKAKFSRNQKDKHEHDYKNEKDDVDRTQVEKNPVYKSIYTLKNDVVTFNKNGNYIAKGEYIYEASFTLSGDFSIVTENSPSHLGDE